jgi:hypothetical protein
VLGVSERLRFDEVTRNEHRMARLLAKVGQARLGFIGEDDPGGVAADGDDPGAADFTHTPANLTRIVIVRRTVTVPDVPDSLARESVLDAFAGPGAPAGVVACTSRTATTVEIAFDDERTAPELIDALIGVALDFIPARSAPAGDLAAVAAAAARGLAEPDLDTGRIIETYIS